MRKLATTLLVTVAAGGLVVGGAFLTAHLLTRPVPTEGCSATIDGGVTELDIDQAESAALISALSVRSDYPARAATIALATAYQESDLENIPYGDRDSVGLFQQRPSKGWGSREEILDPYYATTTFYDALIEVDDYEELPIAEAAQAVQRSADGLAYAQHEPAARALASALTGHSPAAFSCTVLEEPAPVPPRRLRAELSKAFGIGKDSSALKAATIADSDGELRVRTARASHGWAIAHWAVANARRLGMTSVAYDGKRWEAASSADGWANDEDAESAQVVISTR